MKIFEPRVAFLGGAVAVALVASGTFAISAEATPLTGRVALPSPNFGPLSGTPAAVPSTQSVPLRVYLAGRDRQRWIQTALDVSEPTGADYAHYLSAAQFEQDFGPTSAQVSAVTAWLTSEGMTVTAGNQNYLTVSANVGQIDAAFDTQVGLYPITLYGQPAGSIYGASNGFSVPAAMAADIADVTGLSELGSNLGAPSNAPLAKPKAKPAPKASASGKQANVSKRSASADYQCSQYWGQYTETIPTAYGRTTAPTQLCGYTVSQERSAYGVSTSPYTGKGSTVAIVLEGYSPTMLSDANTFFADQGTTGFAPGQYSHDVDTSAVTASCGGTGAEFPEEPLDVETVHIAAPDAKVAYFGVNCGMQDQVQQNMLDAMTEIVDQHLADVVTESYSIDESTFSPAEAAAWTLTFQRGATEGIGFDFDSGDGGDGTAEGLPAAVSFPASDPWATGVGGTSLEIGADGRRAAEYGWGDNVAEIDSAGTGYTAAPPGQYLAGSGGGVSTLFDQPSYQYGVVPTSLATQAGTESAHRTVPDIAANAGSNWLLGYTGAAADGGFGVNASGGGTSGAAPMVAGLEADAKQATGHAVGFANPALYRLGDTPALYDVLPVDPNNPPTVIGSTYNSGPGDDFLTTLGEDTSLVAAPGYDDVTGVGAVTSAFVPTISALTAR